MFGVIYGTVTGSKSGDAVSGARIRARAGGQTWGKDKTDSDGQYVIVLPAGNYKLVFRHDFCDKKTIDNVNVPQDQNVRQDAALDCQGL